MIDCLVAKFFLWFIPVSRIRSWMFLTVYNLMIIPISYQVKYANNRALHTTGIPCSMKNRSVHLSLSDRLAVLQQRQVWGHATTLRALAK